MKVWDWEVLSLQTMKEACFKKSRNENVSNDVVGGGVVCGIEESPEKFTWYGWEVVSKEYHSLEIACFQILLVSNYTTQNTNPA